MPALAKVAALLPRRRKYLLIIFFVAAASGLSSQTVNRNYFRQKIASIYDPNNKDVASQRRRLNELAVLMKGRHLDMDSAYMYLQQRLAKLCFLDAEYDSAVYYSLQSIRVATIGFYQGSIAGQALIDNYYALFYYYNLLDQSAEKYDAADSLIAYSLKENSGFQQAIVGLTYKVEYLFNKGDYSTVNRNAQLGLAITKYLYGHPDSLSYVLYFVTNRFNSLYYSGDDSEAKRLVVSQLEHFKRKGFKKGSAILYTSLGMLASDKGDFDTALRYFDRALQLHLRANDSIGSSQCFRLIGALKAKYFFRYDDALLLLHKSLNYGRSAEPLRVFAEIGNIYSRQNKFHKACKYFQSAYNVVQNGIDEKSLLQRRFRFPGFDQLQALSDLTTAKGEAFVRQYSFTKDKKYLEEAIRIYHKNDLFLSKIKEEQNIDISSALTWSNTARNLYESAIEASYIANSKDDAFYFFEKSRAILLNDEINRLRWKRNADLAQEANLKKQIRDLEESISLLPDTARESIKLFEKLYSAEQLYDEFTNKFKSKNDFYLAKSGDDSVVTLAYLRKSALKKNQNLVEIFSGDSAVYVLTVTQKDEHLSKIDKGLYHQLVSSFNAYISNPENSGQRFANWQRVSHQLYTLIFQNTKLPDGSVIISPDGVNYPFEALVIKEAKQPEYFLDHYATSYAYSAKYLMHDFVQRRRGQKYFLGFAPIMYAGEPKLAGLEGSEISLKSIMKDYRRSTNYISGSATKNNFLEKFPDYLIVQLYTHAAFDKLENDPIIYFADSALYLSKLLPDHKPITQLVVLSACETANGKMYRGEGIFSFNRGFAALGIPAAISTLWSVENGATYRLTELFHKYLSKGLPTDISLQKAKLEFIHESGTTEKVLPYYWAGAILTGKVETIAVARPLPWLEISIGIVILLLAFIVIKRFLFFRRNFF